jgi:hypothetical protein
MPLTITITDTVSIASMGDGWADPTDVAATFSSQLEEAYYSAAIQLYPEAEIQVVVNYQQETMGPDLEVGVKSPGSVEQIDGEAMKESVYAAIKDTKALLGEAFLTNDEAEEEKEEKAVGDE